VFKTTDWNAFYNVLAKGNPPLALQLLALNTIFIIVLIFRRWRGAPRLRSNGALIVQAILIFANVAILTQDQLLPGFISSFWQYWYEFKRHITLF
jgi:hypothetical protein